MRKDGNLSVDRVRGGASESCRTIRLHLPLNRVGDFDRRKVSSTRYMCPWAHFSCVRTGICRSIVSEVVHQRVVVQFGSTCLSIEWAISTGGRSQARGTCVRGIIFMRKDGNLSVDRVRGGASESCRTIRLHLPLNRVGDFDRRKVSSTRYMCPWDLFACVWTGICRSIVSEVVHQRVVVQFGSTCLSIEWAISTGRRFRAHGDG